MVRRMAAERGLLRGVSIFADLDPGSLAALERLTETRDYPERSVVVSQEEPARRSSCWCAAGSRSCSTATQGER
jgi:hypothetical protein